MQIVNKPLSQAGAATRMTARNKTCQSTQPKLEWLGISECSIQDQIEGENATVKRAKSQRKVASSQKLNVPGESFKQSSKRNHNSIIYTMMMMILSFSAVIKSANKSSPSILITGTFTCFVFSQPLLSLQALTIRNLLI